MSGCLILLATALSARAQPTFSPIADQSVYEDQPTELTFLSLSDTNVTLDQIQFTAISSNPEVVQATNINFYAYYNNLGHPGLQRYLSVTPSFGQTGTSTITVIASDGVGSATNSFVFTANPPPPGSARFANTNAITIPLQGTATPYPSEIVVSNMSGAITNMTVTLSQFNHTYPGDVDMLLVAPDNQTGVIIYSRAGDGGMAFTNSPPAVFEEHASNITMTLSDSAIFPLPFPYPLISIPFRPGNYSDTNGFALAESEGFTNLAPNGPPAYFPSPAPDPSIYSNTPVALSSFNGLSANGTWKLYVYDFYPPDSGSLGAWSLMIATGSSPVFVGLTNLATVVNTPTPAISFQVSDPQTAASNLVLTAKSSDPTLVNATNDIAFGGSGTNRTIIVTPEPNKIGTSTISVTVTDNQGRSNTSSFLMTVNPGQVTASGIVASNKVYDATTNATIDAGGATLTGQGLNGSGVTLDTAGAMGAFLDQNVGTDKTVQILGLTLVGTNAGNYILTQPTTTADITPAPLIVMANDDSKVYGQTNTYGSGSTSFASIGLQGGDTIGTVTITASGGAAANAPIGTYSLAPSVATGGIFDPNNYTINYVSGTLTVTPLSVSLSGGRQYDGTSNAPASILSVTNVVAGDSVTVASGNGILANRNVGVEAIASLGDLALGGTSSTNYTLVGASGAVNITPAVLTYVADAVEMAYGSTVPTLSGIVTGFEGGDNLTNATTGTLGFTTTATSASNVGSYPVTGTGLSANDGNYTFAQATGNTTALTVTGAVLTVSVDNMSRAYGQANPVFTVSYSGFVNGEGTNVLSGAPELTTGATTNSPVGNYLITNSLGTLVATNYVVDLANGTLSVTGAVLTASADNVSRAYGQANPVFTVSYIGFVNGEGTNVLSGAPELTTGATTNSPVGDYAITNSLGTLVATNYVVDLANGTLSVTGVVLTVAANNVSRTYGLTNPPFTASYSGFVNGEGSSVLTGTPDLSTSATVSSPPGLYDITVGVGTLSATNYTFSLVNGTLTVVAIPQLNGVSSGGNQIVLSWPTILNESYQLEFKDNITNATWTPLDSPISGTGNSILVTNLLSASPQRFFRLSIGP